MTIDKISHLTIGKLNIKLIHNYQISANAELTVVIDVWSQVKLTKENICSYFYKTIRPTPHTTPKPNLSPFSQTSFCSRQARQKKKNTRTKADKKIFFIFSQHKTHEYQSRQKKRAPI
ncbi:MAG: hypothetical protein IPP27_12230 [Bacteroidetes bacterium]|nr:hypothetical protein [Bacteroidota bacterium]